MNIFDPNKEDIGSIFHIIIQEFIKTPIFTLRALKIKAKIKLENWWSWKMQLLRAVEKISILWS